MKKEFTTLLITLLMGFLLPIKAKNARKKYNKSYQSSSRYSSTQRKRAAVEYQDNCDDCYDDNGDIDCKKCCNQPFVSEECCRKCNGCTLYNDRSAQECYY